MIIDLGSNLFHVKQPDTYWVFPYLLESIENDKNELHINDKNEPNWVPGRWELDYNATREILAKAWVDAFEQTLKDQALPGNVKYTGHGSPIYYNYYRDWANFDFEISEKKLKLLFERAIEDREAFIEYLERYYAKRDGFLPLRTSHIGQWKEDFQGKRGQQEFEWAVSQALDFTMWPTDDERKQWSDDYTLCDAEEFTWIFIEERKEKHG